MTEELQVIAIDGPAGSGKSTIARRLAESLGLEYLDTGAMYRSVTFAVLARGLDPADGTEVAQVAQDMEFSISADGTVIVDGVDATTQIRGTEVTRAVSAVSAHAAVRSELVSRQREWARRRSGGVLEGRDIGSAVFPDAKLKVYLNAAPEVRAARRAGETSDANLERIAAELASRDSADSNRAHDPLQIADGAIEVDTSFLSIEEVIDVIVGHLGRDQIE